MRRLPASPGRPAGATRPPLSAGSSRVLAVLPALARPPYLTPAPHREERSIRLSLFIYTFSHKLQITQGREAVGDDSRVLLMRFFRLEIAQLFKLCENAGDALLHSFFVGFDN